MDEVAPEVLQLEEVLLRSTVTPMDHLSRDALDDLHARMVAALVEQGRIRTPAVERAFQIVPRPLFLPGTAFETVCSGEAIITRRGSDGLPTSSSSEPAIIAIMIEQLRPQLEDRVLEVGAGTGYNAATLAVLVGREGRVATIDLEADIARDARAHLESAGYPDVGVLVGDGWLGVPNGAPYDRIEATASVWDLSPHWLAQLRDGGTLVVPFQLRAGINRRPWPSRSAVIAS